MTETVSLNVTVIGTWSPIFEFPFEMEDETDTTVGAASSNRPSVLLV